MTPSVLGEILGEHFFGTIGQVSMTLTYESPLPNSGMHEISPRGMNGDGSADWLSSSKRCDGSDRGQCDPSGPGLSAAPIGLVLDPSRHVGEARERHEEA